MAHLIDLNEYLASSQGSTLAVKIGANGLDEIILISMTNSRSKKHMFKALISNLFF